MKYIDEFRNKGLIDSLAKRIRRAAGLSDGYRIMDVCGTHTMNIFRFGLKDLLPCNIKLISGPGCPVCVTPNSFIDKAIALSELKNTIIATFGDMFKVPGSYSSLEKEKAKGRQIRVVYSTIDALNIAEKNPAKDVIFLGIGFETTAPTTASSILMAKKRRLRNYYVLCGHKTMPKALEALVADKDVEVDGFMLPGHVSAITGSGPYGFLSKRYKKRCVMAGFEPLDILEAILMIINQRRPMVEIGYKRIINPKGNMTAAHVMTKVFEASDSAWRGMGLIKKSGLKIRKRFRDFDAESKFRIKVRPAVENRNCICGDVLKGIRTPLDCKLFGRLCRPENPVGSCMVSTEGTCAAYYKYSYKF